MSRWLIGSGILRHRSNETAELGRVGKDRLAGFEQLGGELALMLRQEARNYRHHSERLALSAEL